MAPASGTDEATATTLAEELNDAAVRGKPTDVCIEVQRGSADSSFRRE